MRPWRLALAVVAAHGSLQGPPTNCSSKQPTACNAENLCGEYQTPCQNVGSVQNGVDIWVMMKFEFMQRGETSFYKRTELGAFTQKDCEAEDNWLEVEYEGTFKEGGPSRVLDGSHVAETYVASTWITLKKDEVCVKRETMSGTRKCQGILLQTKMAIEALCPCNGRDWSAQGTRQRTNVGLFCTPLEQCPVLHKSLIHQTQYFSYNATASDACFSKVSSEKARGWDDPKDEGCYDKRAPATCPAGILTASAPQRSTLMAMWLVSGLSTLSALLAINHSGTAF